MIPCVLGIDIGTTTVKAMLFDAAGSVLRSAREEYPIHYPQRGWAEQEPDDWWLIAASLVRGMVADAGGPGFEVMAVGVSSQAPSLVAVDAAGRPVGRALIWMDRRAEAEAAELAGPLGKGRIEAFSKNRLDPFYTAAKLLWFKRNMPEAYRRTRRILQINGYVNWRLAGVYSMDSAHASITQLYDVDRRRWDADTLAGLGLSAAMLPEVFDSSAVIGGVTAEAAQATGLRPGTPVIAGTVDGAAAALEAGVVRPGVAAEMSGTSSVLIASNPTGWHTPEIITMTHAVPNQTLSLAAMTSAGASLKWFRDQLGGDWLRRAAQDGGNAYDRMNAEAEKAEPQNEIVFLPYMMGERSPIWDTDARGVFFGLSLRAERGDLIRSIMEGTAFALRHNLEILERSGQPVRTLRLTGGAANSAVWNRIKAEVLQRELEVIEGAGGAPLGDALLAGAAVGLYPAPDVMWDRLSAARPTVRVCPTGQLERYYTGKFELYKELYRRNAELFKTLSSVLKEDA